MASDLFLTKEEIAILTGRKSKRNQIEALRKMGIPFFVNANNAPIVARAVIEGKTQDEPNSVSTLDPQVHASP